MEKIADFVDLLGTGAPETDFWPAHVFPPRPVCGYDVRDRMGVKIGESFMVRTYPQWLCARELVASGRTGQLCSALGFFSYFSNDGIYR